MSFPGTDLPDVTDHVTRGCTFARRSGLWHTDAVQRLITITLLVQAIGVIVLFSIWIVRRGGDDPSLPFKQLQAIIEQQGPATAANFLGPQVMHAASLACRRDACIAERFQGDRGRWVLSTASRGRDPCETFRYPPCRRSRIRGALVSVLAKAVRCEVKSTLNRGNDKRIRVNCSGVQDFVTVTRGPTGQWQLAGDESYPGFLPRLFDGRKP